MGARSEAAGHCEICNLDYAPGKGEIDVVMQKIVLDARASMLRCSMLLLHTSTGTLGVKGFVCPMHCRTADDSIVAGSMSLFCPFVRQCFVVSGSPYVRVGPCKTAEMCLTDCVSALGSSHCALC